MSARHMLSFLLFLPAACATGTKENPSCSLEWNVSQTLPECKAERGFACVAVSIENRSCESLRIPMDSLLESRVVHPGYFHLYVRERSGVVRESLGTVLGTYDAPSDWTVIENGRSALLVFQAAEDDLGHESVVSFRTTIELGSGDRIGSPDLTLVDK